MEYKYRKFVEIRICFPPHLLGFCYPPLFSKKESDYICDMKIIYNILGTLFLVAGVLGIFLPLLPTTPFLLLTAFFYFRGSDRLYQWVIHHKHLGPYIQNFREHKAMPLHAKVSTLVLMWGTMIYCIVSLLPFLWLKVLLALIGLSVTGYIFSLKTLK